MATITNEGGNGAGAGAGSTSFSDTSTAGSATLIANAGVDGGAGASISFYDSSDGGTARFEVFGNATLDVASVSGTHVPTIGSLEGDGIVNLGANSLAIGSANSNTSFAGLIQGTGAVTKVGRAAKDDDRKAIPSSLEPQRRNCLCCERQSGYNHIWRDWIWKVDTVCSVCS